MSLEKELFDNQSRLRKEALARRILDSLRQTLQLRGRTPETPVDDVIPEFTTDSLQSIATLVEAVDILEAIIWASDGCQGHRDCVHSMEPWHRARALLQGRWRAEEQRENWPPASEDAMTPHRKKRNL